MTNAVGGSQGPPTKKAAVHCTDATAGGDDIAFYVVATASTRAKLNRCGDSTTTMVRTIFTT
ncbi:MAG TPA: hypothetical protein VIX19_12270 [Terriglobales bacterium]